VCIHIEGYLNDGKSVEIWDFQRTKLARKTGDPADSQRLQLVVWEQYQGKSHVLIGVDQRFIHKEGQNPGFVQFVENNRPGPILSCRSIRIIGDSELVSGVDQEGNRTVRVKADGVEIFLVPVGEETPAPELALSASDAS
jgi:hypothetical protein